MNELQQATLERNVIIRNVGEIEKNEQDLLTVTQLIINKTNIDVPVHVAAVRRLGRAIEGKSQIRPILLTLESPAEKDRVMAAKRKVVVKGSEIVFETKAVGSDKQFIYFDEHLTKQTADLYYAARQLRKMQLVKYVWIRRGKLYAKKRDGDQPTRITTRRKLKNLPNVNSIPHQTSLGLTKWIMMTL